MREMFFVWLLMALISHQLCCRQPSNKKTTPTIRITAAESIAIVILGKNRVVTAGEASRVWEVPYPDPPPIPFSDSLLRRCATQNQLGADWRLVYIIGFSFKEMYEKRKNDQRPAFYSNKWWKETDSSIIDARPLSGPGYRLFNFQPQYCGLNWKEQEKIIRDNNLLRADEREVAEALFSIALTTGERLLEKVYHWGNLSPKSKQKQEVRMRVAVGYFTASYGLVVQNGPENLRLIDLGVVTQKVKPSEVRKK